MRETDNASRSHICLCGVGGWDYCCIGWTSHDSDQSRSMSVARHGARLYRSMGECLEDTCNSLFDGCISRQCLVSLMVLK